MVYFFDFSSLGRTKKRLNRSTVELNGQPQRDNILKKIKRRFSQSERDVSALNLQEAIRPPDFKSSFDDNLIVYAFGNLAEKPRLKGKFEDNEQLEKCNCTNLSPKTHPDKNVLKDATWINHTTTCTDIFNSKMDLQRPIEHKPAQMETSTWNCHNQMQGDSRGNEKLINSSFYEDEFVCIDLNANSVSCRGDSEELKTAAESQVIENDLKSLQLDGFGARISGNQTRDVSENLQLLNCQINKELDDEQMVLNRTMCDSKNDNGSLEGCDTDVDSKFQAATGILRNVVRNEKADQISTENETGMLSSEIIDRGLISNYDNNIGELEALLKNLSTDDKDSIPQTKSRIHRKNGTCLSPPIGETSDDDPKELPSFLNENINDTRTHRRTERLLSAPSLLQTMPNDQVSLQKVYEESTNKGRCRSLKSALKRRSFSVSSSTSLKVRFNLEDEETSSKNCQKHKENPDKLVNHETKNPKNDSAVSEISESTNYGCADVKYSNEPKKKLRYVMRKFKLKQPLIDYEATYGVTTPARVNTRERKNEVINENPTRSCNLSSGSSTNTSKYQMSSSYIKMEYERNDLEENDEEVKSKRMEKKTVVDRIDAPPWSKPLPGTDKDGSSRPLLHEAAANGDAELLQTLINIGVDLDEKDEEGWPAIHYAIGQGHFDCATLLIKYGADLASYTDKIMACYCKTVREIMIINDV